MNKFKGDLPKELIQLNHPHEIEIHQGNYAHEKVND